jgi:hypothetical protein
MHQYTPPPRAFRLLRMVDGQKVTTVGPLTDIEETFAALGYECLGSRIDARQPETLQGAPRFAGLFGPRWDGDAVLYVEPTA